MSRAASRILIGMIGSAIASLLLTTTAENTLAYASDYASGYPSLSNLEKESTVASITDIEATDDNVDDAQEILENLETIQENLETLEENLDEEDSETGSEPNSDETLEESPPVYAPIRQTIQCPTEIEPLAELLIRDITGYTNRVLQRTVAVLPWTEADVLRALESDEIVREPYRPSHVLVAGKVNLKPLDLNEYAFTTSPQTGGEVTQLFFTTLSRAYVGLEANDTQEYHWVFLTQTIDGWRLAFMFSAIDSLPLVQILTPPRESSESSVGQAIQLWLRDCRAGVIESPTSD